MATKEKAFLWVLPLVIGIAIGWFATHHRVKRPALDVSYRGGPPVPGADARAEEAFYRRRVGAGRPSAADLSSLAVILYERGRRTQDAALWEEARRYAERSLRELPVSNPTAKLVLAKLAMEQHEFERAIALAAPEKTEGALAVLATAWLATGEVTKAAEAADRLVAGKPTFANLSLRALVLLAQGRESEALGEFQRALAIEALGSREQSAWLRAIFARHLQRRGDLTTARALLDEAQRLDPASTLILDLRGEWEGRHGDWKAAARAFNEAFARSRQIPYLIHLAEAEEKRGAKEIAAGFWEQADALTRRELESGRYGHRLDRVRVLLHQGKSAEAARLAEAEAKVRHNAETCYWLSVARLSAGDTRGARTAIDAALRTGAREPDYYRQAAAVYEKLQSRQLAALYRERANAVSL